jgi:hypothetical protein
MEGKSAQYHIRFAFMEKVVVKAARPPGIPAIGNLPSGEYV